MGLRASAAPIERRIAILAISSIAIASSLAGGMVVGLFEPVLGSGLAPSTAVALTTPLLAGHVAWRSITSDRPAAAAIVRSIVAGILNVPCALVVCAISSMTELGSVPSGDVIMIPVGLAIATIFGAPVGGGLGLLFGLAFTAIVPRVRDEIAFRDLGAPARTAIACGLWLLAVASVSVLAAAWDVHGAAISALALGAWGGALTVGGTLVRARARRRLARIARGEVAGWAIVLRESVDASDDLPLLERGLVGDRVLVRVAGAGEGAYRAASTHVAVALLPDREA